MARRKQGLFASLACGLAALALANGASAQPMAVQRFNVPSQSLSEALTLAAQQGKGEIIFNADLTRGKASNALAGNYTLEQAISLLLQNTGLTVRVADNGTLVVEKAASPVTPDEITTVVVTGTLIRGVAPTGTNVVNTTSQQIAETGAANTDAVLGRTPEISSLFNTLPALSPTNPGLKINQPSIRNLGAASGSSTLVLIDGHRMVNTGDQTSPDPDFIPPFALERIEVMPDGGSSTYGADAVGGVINLITKRNFNGVEASAHVGYGDHYRQDDEDLIAGTGWDQGSVYIGLNRAYNNMVEGANIPYAKQVSPNLGYCAPGTVEVTNGGITTPYALPNLIPNTVSTCDTTHQTSWIPQKEREAAYFGFRQAFGSHIKLDVRGFYSRLENQFTNDFNGSGWGQTVVVTPANPFYHPIGPNDPGMQTVLLSFQGLLSNRTVNRIDAGQMTPVLTIDLGHGWQIETLGSYGRSTLYYRVPEINPAAVSAAAAGTTSSTALDPYDLSKTDPAIFNTIYDTQRTGGFQALTDGRVSADGPVGDLPGGQMRLAVGAESTRDVHSEDIVGCCYSGAAYAVRTVSAVFAEWSLPIIGPANSVPGVNSLTLNIAGRNDDYSDFGNTFDPKLGFAYRPLSWVSIRGNWGKSFVAPSLADKSGAPDTRVVLTNNSPFVAPGSPASVSAQPEIIIAGGNPNLQPEKATTWSWGADIKPPMASGLTISATYYDIDMRNNIGVVPFFNEQAFLQPAYSAFIVRDPTIGQVQQAVGNIKLTGNYPSIAALFAAGTPSYLIDARRNNFGKLKQDGIDFKISRDGNFAWGTFTADLAGTYTLYRELAPVAGLPFTDDLPGSSRFNVIADGGMTIGKWTSSVTWSRTGGYSLASPAGTQTRVAAFETVNLEFSYEFSAAPGSKGVRIQLNINNLFDRPAPFYNSDPGFANGLTVGRFVQIGIDKHF